MLPVRFYDFLLIHCKGKGSDPPGPACTEYTGAFIQCGACCKNIVQNQDLRFERGEMPFEPDFSMEIGKPGLKIQRFLRHIISSLKALDNPEAIFSTEQTAYTFHWIPPPPSLAARTRGNRHYRNALIISLDNPREEVPHNKAHPSSIAELVIVNNVLYLVPVFEKGMIGSKMIASLPAGSAGIIF
jgi:hypothetical protein